MAKIIGIDDAKGFRDIVLRQRDLLREKEKASQTMYVNDSSEKDVFYEIRDTLVKIEQHLRKS